MKNFYYRNPDVNRLEIKVPEEKENPAKTALILAIFKMPFMHKLTKSMAENTYVRSKGQNILKTKIDSNTSKTLEQQMQRLRVKQLTQLCKVFNTPIRKGFVERWATWSAWNAFQSAATPAILVSEALEVTVDYEKLPVAKGSLEFEIENVSISSDSDSGTLTVTSPASDYGFGSEPTDTLQLVVLEKEKMRSRIYQVGMRGEDCTESVTLPAGWKLANVAAYVFMLSKNGRKASNSVYVPID